ncbi:DUF2795 domain-containing protein [Umezawaea endophytica]|uniref:DUF2795 domain-containing protein n=1 Tax=Umezawaea endophytica TaxID=1654476 RepID=A0A9X2VUN0_9PSEU|nr:DUF2795 domain-containing protein [Umezawaea endophytica]MCS7482966.1 DUF2795 domain-containing protein [Umezawaea endophytica]
MHDTTTTDRLRTALGDVEYPATKEQLADHASRNNADEDTVHAVRSVPEGVYGSFEEVLRSAAVDEQRDA